MKKEILVLEKKIQKLIDKALRDKAISFEEVDTCLIYLGVRLSAIGIAGRSEGQSVRLAAFEIGFKETIQGIEKNRDASHASSPRIN